MGISLAGVTLALGNIGLKLAPKGEATAYLAANSLTNSLAAGIAPILGGFLADFFANREFSLTVRWTDPGGEIIFQALNLQQWDFFFVFAFLIGLYSLHRLSMVKEIGEVEEKIIVQELISEVKRPIRNLTTVGGLNNMIQFPFYVLRTALKREKESESNTR
jgi:MFS family permease